MSRPPAEEEEEDPLSASDTAKDIMDDNTVPNQNMVTEVLMVIKSPTTCYLFKLPWTTRMLEHCALCHTDENVLIPLSQFTPKCNFTLRNLLIRFSSFPQHLLFRFCYCRSDVRRTCPCSDSDLQNTDRFYSGACRGARVAG